MPERKKWKRPFLKRILNNITGDRDGKLYHDETEPLISIDEFYRLLSEIDLIQISGVGKHDRSKAITSFSVETEEMKGISQRAREFLSISKKTASIQFSLYHRGGNSSWVAIENKEKRIQFVFDTQKTSCVAYLQTLKGESWDNHPEVIHPFPDVEKVLKVGRNLKNLINRSGSP